MILMQKKEPTEKVSQILNDTFELETYVPFIVYDPMYSCFFFILFFGTILFFTSTSISIYIFPGDLVTLLIIDWVHWAWILNLYFKFIIRKWNKVYGIVPFYVPGSFTVKEHPSFVSIPFCSIITEIIFWACHCLLEGVAVEDATLLSAISLCCMSTWLWVPVCTCEGRSLLLGIHF